MSEFAAARFSAPERRMRLVVERALGLVDATAPLRILDIACGDGSHALALAQALPNSQVLGVDISGPNIAAAEAARQGHPAGNRVEFRLADYLTAPCGTFDLVLSMSGLNCIPASPETQLRKINSELTPRGLLLVTLPGDCTYNRSLIVLRRLMRALRGPATDALAVAAARLIHGNEYSRQEILERLIYFYTPPTLLDGLALRGLARSLGWKLVLDEPVEHASPAQLKHRLLAWKKPEAA